MHACVQTAACCSWGQRVGRAGVVKARGEASILTRPSTHTQASCRGIPLLIAACPGRWHCGDHVTEHVRLGSCAPELVTRCVGVWTWLFVCGSPVLSVGVGARLVRLGGALVQSPVAVEPSLSHDSPAALQRPLPPKLAGRKVGDTCWVAESGRAHRGLSPCAPPALSGSGPAPAAPASNAASERTAARGAQGGGSAPRGPSRGQGRQGGGQSKGSAVETPGAAGHARQVSAAAGPPERESGASRLRHLLPIRSRARPRLCPTALHPGDSLVPVLCPSLRLFSPSCLSRSLSISLSLSNFSFLSASCCLGLSLSLNTCLTICLSPPLSLRFCPSLSYLSLRSFISCSSTSLTLPVSLPNILSLSISVSLPCLCLIFLPLCILVPLSLCVTPLLSLLSPCSISIFTSSCHCLCRTSPLLLFFLSPSLHHFPMSLGPCHPL